MQTMRMTLGALAVVTMALPTTGRAQQQDVGYEEKRRQLVRELEGTQRSLQDLRGERTQLAARIDNAMAQVAQQRALALTLSSEQNALLSLDSLLNGAQQSLSGQRERLVALGDAMRRSTGAMLVVLFRTDSGGTQGIEGASLGIDGATPVTRSYTATASGALGLGAVDEVFRGTVLPTAHTLAFTATVNGQPVTQRVEVTAAGESVTYVQFTLRNGQLVPTTWTTRGTTPF